jgi:pimeloyl-ACP methyl ester carboxylesterase
MKIAIPDIVVLLPGITGSVLAKDGKEFWAPSGGAVLRNLFSLGKALKQGLLADEDDWRAPDLGDGVKATQLMPDVHLLPGLWKIDGYGEIEKFLLTNFELTRNRNYFPFPYDWRRDNRASALLLRQQSERWLAEWRSRPGNEDAQLVLIGHSMGGLISRYFTEALEGWKDTRAVITFGTPFYGSLNALDFMVNGFEKKLGPISIDLSEAMRSMRSVHQLVPSYRCVYRNGTAATPMAADLPGWRPGWNIALSEFGREVEEAATANRADPAFVRNPTVYQPIVGTDQPTKQSAEVTGGSVRLAWDRGGEDEGGDGTVPLLSAALSGTEQQRTFAPEQHARLQNYNSMLAHLKGVLSSLYHVRVEDLRSTVTVWFSYRADDLYFADEPLVIELGTRSALDESLLPDVEAVVTFTDQTTGLAAITRPVIVTRNLARFEFGLLPAGTYTVQVTGSRAGTAPLSDVVAVAERTELEV